MFDGGFDVVAVALIALAVFLVGGIVAVSLAYAWWNRPGGGGDWPYEPPRPDRGPDDDVISALERQFKS